MSTKRAYTPEERTVCGERINLHEGHSTPPNACDDRATHLFVPADSRTQFRLSIIRG
jgi:hypothetical protein